MTPTEPHFREVVLYARDASLATQCASALQIAELTCVQGSTETETSTETPDPAVALVRPVVIADSSAEWVLGRVRGKRRGAIGNVVIAVTANTLPPHVAQHLFDAGADDCVLLPLDPSELSARAAAVIYRVETNWVEQILKDRLTKTERTIFSLLRHKKTWVDSHEMIHTALGTCHAADTPLIRVHIHNIREKLQGTGLRILSQRGRGYRLVSVATRGIRVSRRADRPGDHNEVTAPKVRT